MRLPAFHSIDCTTGSAHYQACLERVPRAVCPETCPLRNTEVFVRYWTPLRRIHNLAPLLVDWSGGFFRAPVPTSSTDVSIILPLRAVPRGANLMVRSVPILLIAAVAAAQTGVHGPAFEVASVKRYTPQLSPGIRAIARRDPAPSQLQISGTRVSAKGNLMRLVAVSYGLEPFQVSQSQEWADQWDTSEVYEIDARAPGDAIPTLAQVREMMQTLLAERFQLKVSRRNQVMPVYNLVVAPGGSKLEPSIFMGDPPRTRDKGSAGQHIRTRCLNCSMADLVEMVRRQFDSPLLDKTGLSGGFDFNLDYSAQLFGMTADVAAAMGAADLEPGLPIVGALRE